MPRINILPKSIAELIAAGEVVERPASVVMVRMELGLSTTGNAISLSIPASLTFSVALNQSTSTSQGSWLPIVSIR